MTFPDLTICFEDTEEREKLERDMKMLRRLLDADSDRAKGTYDGDDIQGEPLWQN